jgi:hypothetical protein
MIEARITTPNEMMSDKRIVWSEDASGLVSFRELKDWLWNCIEEWFCMD